MTIDTASIASIAVAQKSDSFSQQVAVVAVRRELDAQRAVADLVAQTANAIAPAPPGQGQRVDVTV